MSSGRQIASDQIGLGFVAAGVGIGIAVFLARRSHSPARTRLQNRNRCQITSTHAPPESRGRSVSRVSDTRATVMAARRLSWAAGILSASVLLDSAVEHYRSCFFNRAMFIPLAVSSMTLGISAHGVADQREGAHRLRDLIYITAALTGAIGTAFHIYNVAVRRGGFVWQNLFYGAPLGAPAAIALSGLLGAAAERVRGIKAGSVPRIFGLPAGRITAAIAAAGLLGSAGEAALLHFRGAFHNPFMLLPVTLPPTAAALMTKTAFGLPSHDRWFTRRWLRITDTMGLAGACFHAYGVNRNMGGWRNWSQNVLNGPPLSAPPSFTGLAFAGLAALGLLEDYPNA